MIGRMLRQQTTALNPLHKQQFQAFWDAGGVASGEKVE
jgi:hypothetical protein